VFMQVTFGDTREFLYSTFYQKAFETFDSGSNKRLEMFLVDTRTKESGPAASRRCLAWFPGMTPPQNATSAQH